MTIPNGKTGATIAINLTSNDDYDFAAWYRIDGELVIGRRKRDDPGRQRWGIDHTQYVVGGTPRTTLALPVQDDEHAYPSMACDDNGRLHVWANMHNQPMRAIRTVDPHTSNTWTSDSGWTSAVSDLPSVEDRCTYSTPIHFPDGSMVFYLRNGDDGISGQYNSYLWDRAPAGTTWGARRFVWQGVSIPDAGGPGIPGGDGTTAENDRTNWSVYPTNFYVENDREPHPGRCHVSWVWRCEGVDGFSNVWPSYAYSDDKLVTFKTITGATLTQPITPQNSVASRCSPACKGAWVRSISRSSNLVVAELDTVDHGFVNGDSLYCRVIDTSYDGQFSPVTVNPGGLGQNVVAWSQTAADDAAGGTGSVTNRRYLNWGSMCVDRDGLPHILGSNSPAVWIRRNAANTAWVETAIANPLGGVIFMTVWGGAFWRNGGLWGLSLGDPGSARRIRMWRIDEPGASFVVSGDVGNTDTNWDPSHNIEAWRRFGEIQVLAPDGNSPWAYSLGPNGAKRQVEPV